MQCPKSEFILNPTDAQLPPEAQAAARHARGASVGSFITEASDAADTADGVSGPGAVAGPDGLAAGKQAANRHVADAQAANGDAQGTGGAYAPATNVPELRLAGGGCQMHGSGLGAGGSQYGGGYPLGAYADPALTWPPAPASAYALQPLGATVNGADYRTDRRFGSLPGSPHGARLGTPSSLAGDGSQGPSTPLGPGPAGVQAGSSWGGRPWSAGPLGAGLGLGSPARPLAAASTPDAGRSPGVYTLTRGGSERGTGIGGRHSAPFAFDLQARERKPDCPAQV